LEFDVVGIEQRHGVVHIDGVSQSVGQRINEEVEQEG